MAKNETRKICPRCGYSFISTSPGGVTLSDGKHCTGCLVEIRVQEARERIFAEREVD